MSDRIDAKDKFDRIHLKEILERALLRELQEELACQLVKICEILSIAKVKIHDQEVLYYVEVGSFDWSEKTGKEFTNPNKGTYELVRLKDINMNEENLGKKNLRLKPKPWLKLIIQLFEK